MSFQRRIGEHEVRVDDADIMTIVFRGSLGAQDMQEILRAHDEKLLRDGDLFVISDLRSLTSVEPGARHALGARSRTLPGYCVAYMVPSFQVKLFLEVLLRAANFRLKGKVVYRIVDDEASGREWLIDVRHKRKHAPV